VNLNNDRVDPKALVKRMATTMMSTSKRGYVSSRRISIEMLEHFLGGTWDTPSIKGSIKSRK